jgi:hypothetical protein
VHQNKVIQTQDYCSAPVLFASQFLSSYSYENTFLVLCIKVLKSINSQRMNSRVSYLVDVANMLQNFRSIAPSLLGRHRDVACRVHRVRSVLICGCAMYQHLFV